MQEQLNVVQVQMAGNGPDKYCMADEEKRKQVGSNSKRASGG